VCVCVCVCYLQFLFLFKKQKENARLKVKLFQFEKQSGNSSIRQSTIVTSELPKKELTPTEHRGLVVKVDRKNERKRKMKERKIKLN